MENFKVEVKKIWGNENPYIKVYVNVGTDIDSAQSFLEKLPTVSHVNQTSGREGINLTVYPKKTCVVEEVKENIEKQFPDFFK